MITIAGKTYVPTVAWCAFMLLTFVDNLTVKSMKDVFDWVSASLATDTDLGLVNLAMDHGPFDTHGDFVEFMRRTARESPKRPA